ncbi:MAG: Ig-like domain-containing protein [Abditibacteriota bacterium]|nr:Ig-like domain-containing protein [Abditibacteriota bacterium]
MKKTILVLWLLFIACAVMAAESVAPLNPEYLEWVQSGKKAAGIARGGRIPVPVGSFFIPSEEPVFKLGELPAYYDLRSEGKVSPIRDQGPFGICWVFGAIASMEGSWLMDNPYGSVDYSTFNVVRNTAPYWGVDLESGGHYLISSSYFARLLGPVYEKDEPFDPGASGVPAAPAKKPAVRAYITEAEYIPDHLMHDTSILDGDKPSQAYMDDIKRSIMSKGVIDFSYYHSNSYLNSANGSYYCDNSYYANHEISIVGWDDNYSRSKFNKTPAGNGAWLARNSWGTGFGNSGYMWISYYDKSACDYCQFSLTTDLARYSRVYELEAKGLVTSGSYTQARSAFTMKQDGSTVDAGTYCMAGGETLRCTVYVNGTKAASGEKYCKYPGYYLIPVKASFAKGDKVICRIQYADNKQSGIYYTPLTDDLSMSSNGDCQLSNDGSDWTDTREAFGTPYANCIKLYTRDASSSVAVTGVSLDKTSLSLKKGDTYTLAATVKPSDATNKTVTWSSGDTAVAKVSSEGKVTAVGSGTCNITVKTKDGGFTAKCKVTVAEASVPVTGVTLSDTEIKLKKGESKTLTATVKPSNATNKNVTWTSDDTSIATVSSTGVVKAVSGGTVKIRVKTRDGGFSAKCKVKVTVPVTGVTLNKKEMTLTKGASETLTATIAPSDATNKELSWKSYDESIVTIASDGTVTAVGAGKTKVRAKTRDGGFTAYCWIKVTVPVTGVTLNKSSLTIAKGASAPLTATVLPSDATKKDVKWKSYDTSIATVDQNGKVKGVAKGTTTVRVQTRDGDFRAKCKVTVN